MKTKINREVGIESFLSLEVGIGWGFYRVREQMAGQLLVCLRETLWLLYPVFTDFVQSFQMTPHTNIFQYITHLSVNRIS